MVHGLHSSFAQTWTLGDQKDGLGPWLQALPASARVLAYEGPMQFSSGHNLLDKIILEEAALRLLEEISQKVTEKVKYSPRSH